MGPSEVPQMISEIQTVANTLADYSNKLGSYLFNPAGNPLPQFSELVPTLNVDQLLSRAKANNDSAVDSSAGAMTSTVYKVAGIVREVNTRMNTKTMIYSAGISQIGASRSETLGSSGKTVSDLTGKSPNQSEGI